MEKILESPLKFETPDYLTQHFTIHEFNNHNLPWCNYLSCNYRHIAVFLEMARMSFRAPIIVTSGYRNEAINKQVGGVSNSMHLLGKAVDITCDPHRDLRDLYFAVNRYLPPSAKFYHEFHPTKRYIHLQFGERDQSPLNLIQYFPFQEFSIK